MRNYWFAGLLAVGTCALLLGCETKPADTGSDDNGAADAAHDHSAAGPHGGHVIVLGAEAYHAELTHDDATHTVAVYLLDSTGKKAVSSEQETITLQLFEQGEFVDYTLEATGDEGAFSTTDEQLSHLLHSEDAKGRLHVTIAGKQYVGTIEHAAHDHAGDGHGGDGHTDDDAHEHADGDAHEHADGTPHEHADGDAHEHADGDAHEHADGEAHEHDDGEAHEHADGDAAHDHADGDAHDHADDADHDKPE